MLRWLPKEKEEHCENVDMQYFLYLEEHHVFLDGPDCSFTSG